MIEQLHQGLVRRRARRLHDEAVHAADVLADLDVDLAVGEVRDVRAAKRNLDELADFVGERAIRVPVNIDSDFSTASSVEGIGDLPPMTPKVKRSRWS